jgi:hypothetical protein
MKVKIIVAATVLFLSAAPAALAQSGYTSGTFCRTHSAQRQRLFSIRLIASPIRRRRLWFVQYYASTNNNHNINCLEAG